jgi:hypothetical protein
LHLANERCDGQAMAGCIDNGGPPARCRADEDCADDESCVEGFCTAPGACDDVTPYRMGTIVRGTTVGAPAGNPGACGGGSPGRVFSVAVREDSQVCVSLAGSGYDTVLHVREANCQDGEGVACNDDAGGLQSQLEFVATAGTEYFIFVDGFGGRAVGNFQLAAALGSCRDASVPNCNDEIACAEGFACVENVCLAGCESDDACAPREFCTEEGLCISGCRDLEGGGSTCPEGDFCLEGQCANCRDDEMCGDNEICVGNLCQFGCRADDQCRRGSICVNDACVGGCRDDDGCGVNTICEADRCVRGCRDDAGCSAGSICEEGVCERGCRDDATCAAGTICEEGACERGCRVDATCPVGNICEEGACEQGCRVDETCGVGFVCALGQCEVAVANGTCEMPNRIGDGLHGGNTDGAENNHAGSCGGAGAPEAVFVYIPEADGQYCANTAGSTYDTLLYVRAGECAEERGASLECNDDGNDFEGNDLGLQSAIAWQGRAEQPYFVFVDGFRTGGIFQLSIGPCGGEAEEEPRACGGIRGIECPEGQRCVDDPNDRCDPERGGADCPGICEEGARPPQPPGGGAGELPGRPG